MRFAWRITEATNAQSEYAILTDFLRHSGYANAPQCYVYTYFACHVLSAYIIFAMVFTLPVFRVHELCTVYIIVGWKLRPFGGDKTVW